MITKTVFIIFIAFLLSGCIPKTLFPNDNKKYDSVENYNYSYTEHKFNSQDKSPLYGLYIKTDEESKGLIVVANGMYQNMSSRFAQWLWMVDAGYDLFIFDYRGYGESHAEVDLFGFRDDVNAALEYAHSLDKDGEIVLIGQSMGGTFVIDALVAQEHDYVSLAVIDSTFTGFDASMSTLMMKSILLFPLSWLPYVFIPSDLNSIDNIEYLKVPVLFVSGDNDFVVHHDNSKRLYEKANKKKSIWIVKDAGHVRSFNDLRVRKAFLELLTDREKLTKNQNRYFDK